MSKMKEQIQNKIRQNLDESMTILKRNMAKMLGLEHQAYDLWKSKNGDKYIWNKTRNTFDKHEVEKTNDEEDAKTEIANFLLRLGL